MIFRVVAPGTVTGGGHDENNPSFLRIGRTESEDDITLEFENACDKEKRNGYPRERSEKVPFLART